MSSPKLSNELRRFIHSIASIPHLEAILLLHQSPHQEWNAHAIAQRLYLSDEQAANMLRELSHSGICALLPDNSEQFIYAPAAKELNELIEQLASFYSSNLIEVTNMIHSRAHAGRLVHLFADAFKFNRDK
jgi:uncharacterized protein (DUF924 family)